MQVPVLISPAALLEWAKRVRLTLNPIAQGYPFQQLSADPTGVAKGFTYYNTTSNTVRQFTTIWRTPVLQSSGPAWTLATGTASRATFATFAGQVIGAAYTQAQVQAIDDHVVILSQRMKALIDDLKANGALT